MPNSKINYLEIIRQAAGITWRNKYLWWFGFFVLLGAAGGGFSRYSPNKEVADKQKIFELISAHREWAIFAGLAMFVLWIVLLVVGVTGRGALIKSVNDIIERKETSFKSGWKEGKKYFWKILFIGLLSGAFILALLIVFAIPIGFLFYNKAYFLGGALSLLAIAIFIPVVFLVSFTIMYGYLYVALSDLPLGEALENAYALLRKNIANSLILALFFLVAGAVATLAALLVIIPLVVLFFIMGMLLFLLAKQIGATITAAIAVFFILIFMFLGGAAYQVFAHAVLVLFFREIASPKEEEKITEPAEEINPAHATDPIIGS